jgi:hypothetical protein
MRCGSNLTSALALLAVFMLVASRDVFAQRICSIDPIRIRPMKLPPPDTNAIRWHTIVVPPKDERPKIHFYDKLNPVWWFGNADEPLPPEWYRLDEKLRVLKWRLRNPLHNFTHYVIGVEDKTFSRSGKFPERNSDPRGGWNIAMGRRVLVPLPFVSCERSWCTFYFGWRNHGAFGLKLAFHRQTKPDSKTDKTSPPVTARQTRFQSQPASDDVPGPFF